MVVTSILGQVARSIAGPALGEGVGVPAIWILATGFWVDFARWYDNENWID